ncbi:MAG: FeoB-associated Cys-rich membrane protein [Clostridia bacterium]|nr:FeoB-associated Cys-rich membrane protein [Clostridia bacterium]
MLADIIIVAILAAICTGIIIYIVRQKRRGVKCIGCPYSGECSNKNNSGCCCEKK